MQEQNQDERKKLRDNDEPMTKRNLYNRAYKNTLTSNI